MARIQILELPEGGSDDRPPFVLVIDQAPRDENSSAFRDDLVNNEIANRIGARHVLVFEDTIDIPANDVPVDENGHPPFLKVHVEGEFEKLREQAEEEIRAVQQRMATSLGGVDYDELAEAVQDALGITPGNCPANPADVAGWLLTACRELKKSEAARAHLREDRTEARQWARHGYEIGQKHCGWSDHGVAPAWLTDGWPPHIDSCEHLKVAAEYDTALRRVRSLHRPVEYRGTTICGECSAFAGSSTDNAPVAYDQCGTLLALNGDQPDTDA